MRISGAGIRFARTRVRTTDTRRGSMKITILTHVEREGVREYDAVVPQVAAALRKLGHKPSVLGVHGDISKLVRGVRRRKPDLLFNLMETFGDDELGSVAAVG